MQRGYNQAELVNQVISRSTLITIINSLVFSKLFYCSSMWASTTKKNIATASKGSEFCGTDFDWRKDV